MSNTDNAAAKVFQRQHGVIATAQALRVGLSAREIQTRVETGRWHRVARGVFTLAGAPATFSQRVMAACLSAGDGAAASHATARHFLARTSYPPPRQIELTVPLGRSARAAKDVGVHHSRTLASRDIVRIDHIPVTKPARLLVDMATAAATGQGELDDLVDEILTRYPRLSPRALHNQVNQVNPKLRRALGPWLEGPRPESVPEMALQRRLTEAGMPPPERQFVIVDPETGLFVARFDLAYPDANLAIEYDGRRSHGPRQAGPDAQRRRKISENGWTALTAYARDADRATCNDFVETVGAAMRPPMVTRPPTLVRSPLATNQRAAS